ncbi:MAG: AbrB family transcriptional regulator, partial [Beijerinckiaceae bacterium]
MANSHAQGMIAQWKRWAALLPAIVCAFLGGLLFTWLGLPAPWISGSMLGALASALIVRLPDMPVMMRETALLIAGITMGSGVMPETVALIKKMPISFVLLLIAMAATIFVASAWLTRLHGWRHDDAVLASAPGALSSVIAIAHERGSDMAGIAAVQTVRLFVLVALLPGLISSLESAAPAAPMHTGWMTGTQLLIIAAASAVLGLLFRQLGLAAPLLISGALVSATLHGSDIVSGAMPPVIAIGGFVMIGVMIATRMNGVTLGVMRRYALPSVICFVTGVIIATAFAWLASVLVGVRFGAALLAFAPGGLEAMSMLSIALNLDPLYVGAHHIARFMGIGLMLPVMIRIADARMKSVAP